MTPVGLIGILLALAALPFATIRRTPERVLLAFALLGAHVASSIVYFSYVQSANADTGLYYHDLLGMTRWPFQFGTVFTVVFVQAIKSVVGGSYFDYFMMFQAIGFWGIALLMRTFEEIQLEFRTPPSLMSYVLLFFPGIHFWSSAIGKDAPIFFACALAFWSIRNLSKRIAFFVLALFVMVLFRPYVALITTVALAGAAFLGRGTSLLTRIGLLVLAIAGTAVAAVTVESTFEVRVTDANSVTDFFARRDEISASVEGDAALHEYSFLMRMVSLMFRPFFFDAEEMLGYVASVENLALIAVIAYLAFRWRLVWAFARHTFYARFGIIYTVLMVGVLTLIYYNVGLGLRQRVMVLPALFSVFVATLALAKAGSRQPMPGIGEPVPQS